MKAWLAKFRAVLLAEDDALDVLVSRRPKNGRSLSAHAASARAHGKLWGCLLCKFLDWIEANHCNDALKNDEARAQAVIDDLKE